MGNCRNHQNVETGYLCSKYKYYVCEKCLTCADPEIYCKYRSSCIIHYAEKDGSREKSSKLEEIEHK